MMIFLNIIKIACKPIGPNFNFYTRLNRPDRNKLIADFLEELSSICFMSVEESVWLKSDSMRWDTLGRTNGEQLSH